MKDDVEGAGVSRQGGDESWRARGEDRRGRGWGKAARPWRRPCWTYSRRTDGRRLIYKVLSLNSGMSRSFYGITPLLNRVRSPFPLMWMHRYFYKITYSSAWLMEFTGSNPQWAAGPVQRAGWFCERGPIARLQTKANRQEGRAITQTYFLRQHQSSTKNISLSWKDYLLIGC